MPLPNGTVLGNYEIEAPIGAGGMGEVYKARDTRLDRIVAIKVLPQHLAENDQTRQRFAREAKAISALSHPNICTLYDIGKEDGIYFLVMEYIEGETLAARLEQGALDKDAVLKTAIEIANALDAAHRQGFIHRDLKPGNIMLTRSGAKLLDFGLARPTAQEVNETDLTISPTVSQPLTEEGAIVGTFQYMAPEQLEGGEPDARTDIFAFGATVYEMVTGQKAFSGKTQASLIASILKEEPRPIAQLQPMTPPALDRVVTRCLAKDPDDRWQTARDLMLELEWIRDGSSTTAGTPAPVKRRRKGRERLAWIVAGVATIAAAALAWAELQRPQVAREPSRFEMQIPTHLNAMPGQSNVQVSPDGRYIAFSAIDEDGSRNIYVRAMSEREPRVVSGTRSGFIPFWSPDSRHIACFRAADGKLVRAPIAGGTAQVLCDASDGRGGTWSADNMIVFAPTSGGPLMKVPATGGTPEPATQIDDTTGESGHRWPQFLPDGRHFFYVSLPAKNNRFATFVGSLDSFDRVEVVEALGGARYARPGYVLYQRDETLVARAYDASELSMGADEFPLNEVAGQSGGWSGSPSVSVSQNGVLARVPAQVTRTELHWYDYNGRLTGDVPVPEGIYAYPQISPNGRHAAVADGIGTGWSKSSDILVVDLPRALSTRFSYDDGEDFSPVWSPDSKRIVYSSDRTGKESLFMNSIAGGQEEMVMTSAELFMKPAAWSPDGRSLLYTVLSPTHGQDIYMTDLDGDRQPQPLLVGEFSDDTPAISPDGRWFAYRSNETGRFELYVQSFPELGNKYRVSSEGAANVWWLSLQGWSPDGKQLIWTAPDNLTVMGATVSTDDGFSTGTPFVMFKLPATRFGSALDPTRERILVSVPGPGPSPAYYIVTDWDAALGE